MEISEISLSYVLKQDINLRIEAEFFKKEYLAVERLFELKSFNYLNAITKKISDGTHFTPKYTKTGTPFLSALNVKENYLDISGNYKFISIKEHEEIYKRCDPKANDILLRKVGVGARFSCVVPKNIFEFSIFVSVAQIRCRGNDITPLFLSTFINSKLGQIQLLRLNKGSSQPDLHLEEIRKLKVPVIESWFQDEIDRIVNLSLLKLEQSKADYQQAETLLLTELELLSFKPSTENIAIKSFSESFGSSGRLDSEYYQPKYDELIEKIKLTVYDSLKNIVSIKKSIEPGSEAYQEEGIPFVRVSNLTKFEITQPNIHLSDSLFDKEELESLQPKKDTILLSKDGTVGIAYTVKDETNMITSGALLHLTLKNETIRPEYLTLVLNSIVVQMQSERDAGGSIIKHWKPSEIKEVLIPIIDLDLQIQIEQKIKASFKLKAESKQLLDLAKLAVEMVIEKNEEVALEYIENQIKELNHA